MKVTEQISDTTGLETLDTISRARKFNHWMYSAVQPFCLGEILEIGSGIGNISDFFIQAGSNVHLSDIRKEYCYHLQDKFTGTPHFSGVTQLDLVDNSFDNTYSHLLERFDTVFSLNVLEHIYDHNRAIANANKLLKSGGKLIILVPAYPFLYCRFDKELGHYRRYTRKSLSDVIAKNGNSIQKIFHFNAAGIAGWFLFGKLWHRKQIAQGEMGLFNRLVPLFKFIDRVTFRKIGLSLIIVAVKPVV